MKQKKLLQYSQDAISQVSQKQNLSTAKKVAKAKPFDASSATPTWLSKSRNVSESTIVDTDESSPLNDGDHVSSSSSSQMNCTTDDAFIAYLVQEKADLSGIEWSARQYLLAELPYKGRHLKSYKSSIRKAGGRYLKNPKFKPGVWDPDVPFGWYVACSVHELKSLLSLLRTASGEKAWKPDGFSDDECDAAIRSMLDMMDDFEDKKQQALDRQRRANLAQKKEREAQTKAAAVMGNVWADRPEEIERLETLLGGAGTYDAVLIRSSATFNRLGPPMSTNAKRVLRALHLKILTPNDVQNGDFDGSSAKRGRTQRRQPTREMVKGAQNVYDSRQSEHETENANSKRSKRSSNTDLGDDDEYLMTDEQIEMIEKIEKDERERQAMRENGAKMCPKETITLLTNTEMKATQCPDCDSNIDDQFLDCACDGVQWKKCRTCFSAYTLDVGESMPSNSAKRRMPCRCPCTCSFPDVEYPVEHAAEEEMQADGENASAKANDETTQQNTKTRAEFENVPIHDDDL